MKKIIKFMFLLVLIFPTIISAGTYKQEVKNANELIKQEYYINTYEKYILIGNKTKYEYSNGKVRYNSSFKKGGFISIEEYELTKVKGLSYLLTNDGYWTLSKNKNNIYAITKDDIETAKSENSDYSSRVTEYVRPKTVVSGSGTQNDPWQFDPMYKVSVKVDKNYATIEGGNNEYVKGNCSTEECTSRVKLSGKTGYRYISNDCDGVYDIKTRVLTIKNVKRNLECNVEFGYGLFEINLSDAKPETIYAIYGENFYSDVDNKKVIKSLTSISEKKGYSFDGFSYEGLKIVDANKNLIKSTLNSITKDLTLEPDYVANKYTVIYNCNGGYDAPKNQGVTYDAPFTITTSLCKREGYIQTGWDEKKEGTGTSWNVKNRTKWNWNIDSNVTLYATWKKCAAGTYSSANDNSCSACPVGTYSSAGAGKCNVCPSGYTSELGADDIKKCYIEVSAGMRIDKANSSKPVECGTGQYKEAHKVNYGENSSCDNCPPGYNDGSKLEDKTNINRCLRKVLAGYYISVAHSSGNTVCDNGYYSEAHEVRLGQTSKCELCPAGYRDGSKLENKTSQNKCLRNVTAGYYIASSKSINNTICPNGYYSTTHSIVYGETSECSLCPDGYQDGRKLDNKISKNTCLKNVPAGSYVSTEKATNSKVCANGFYKEAHALTYGQTSTCNACPEGYRDGNTVSNKTSIDKCLKNVSGGYYISSQGDKNATLCADGYYKDKHGVTYGKTSTCSQCPEGYRDGKSSTSKSSKNSCTRIVESGYYLASSNDTTNTLCAKGYYKGTHNVRYGQTSTCNICPDGYRDGTSLESKTAENKCLRNVDAGYYIVGSKATNDTECPTGYYKTAHSVAYGSVSRCSVCPSGYRNGTSLNNKTSQNACIRNVSQNHYIAKSGDDKDTACPSGTKKQAHTVLFGETSSCN